VDGEEKCNPLSKLMSYTYMYVAWGRAAQAGRKGGGIQIWDLGEREVADGAAEYAGPLATGYRRRKRVQQRKAAR
jgi:hypothetical protein